MALTLFRAYISVPAETGYHRELTLDLWEDTAKSQGAASVVRSAAVIEEMEYIAEKDVYVYRVTGPAMPGDDHA